MIPGPLLEPLSNLGGLVRSVVIQHQMDIQVGRGGRIDFFQEIEELYRAMTAIAFAQYPAGGDIQSRKQTGHSMSLIVVRAALKLTAS